MTKKARLQALYVTCGTPWQRKKVIGFAAPHSGGADRPHFAEKTKVTGGIGAEAGEQAPLP